MTRRSLLKFLLAPLAAPLLLLLPKRERWFYPGEAEQMTRDVIGDTANHPDAWKNLPAHYPTLGRGELADKIREELRKHGWRA